MASSTAPPLTGADRFLAATRRRPTDCTPIWFMRQAGRCLTGYRELRERYDILTLTRTPELCARVTLMPVEEFGVDAAVMYADIMLPLVGMGVPFSIDPGVGPIIHSPLRSRAAIDELRIVDPREATPDLFEAIRMVRTELDSRQVVIGFAGGPFTVASYMIEGGATKDFAHTKGLLYGEPVRWHRLMETLTEVTIRYLRAQVDAGAQVVQLFDSWAGALSRDAYETHVLPYSTRIFRALRDSDTPTIHFSTNTAHLLEVMAGAGSDVISVDWRLPLDEAWTRVGAHLGIQGNLEPAALIGSFDVSASEARTVLCARRWTPWAHLQPGARRSPADAERQPAPPRRARARGDRGSVRRALRQPWWTLPVIGLVASLPLVVRRVGDPDFFWHELTGQWMVQHRAVATHELYTYTVPGTPWTDHEYLTQLLFYGLQRVGGLLAVSIVFGAITWAGFWLIYARIRQMTYAPAVAGLGLFLGAAAGFPLWGPRPQMFDVLFISLVLLIIERFLAVRSRAIFTLPLVVLIWANFHGGFVFGFFFLGLTAFALLVRWLLEHDRGLLIRLRDLVVVTFLCGVASLITPYGPALFVYVWRTQFSSQLSGFVLEWQSPDFHTLQMLPFLGMLLLVFIGFAWRRPRLHDVLLTLGTTILALRAWFFIPVFVVATTPVLVWQWSEPWSRLRTWLRTSSVGRPREWIGEALVMVLALATVGGVGVAGYTLRGQAASTRANYPAAAADWLAAHPGVGTRIFNEYSWGGYIAYRFYPNPTRRVFIYGESELVGDTLLARYADVNQLHPDWEHVLDEYGVDYVLFPPGFPVDAALDASPGWQRVYTDTVAVIWVRRAAVTAHARA